MSSTSDQNHTSQAFRLQISAMFIKYREIVLLAALRITGNKKDAEDVLQNVFTRLIQRPSLQSDFCTNPAGYLYHVFTRLIQRPSLQSEFCTNPGGYLYRAATHEAVDFLEARQRQKLMDDDISTLEIPAPERDRDYEDKMQRIRAAMTAMNPDSIEILTLFHCEGYSCREIAKIRNKKLPAILKELCRARAVLRKTIRMQERNRETQKGKYPRNRRGTLTETSEA
jgi:RNA polymerase sigma factor (sigma-70 family)